MQASEINHGTAQMVQYIEKNRPARLPEFFDQGRKDKSV